ncbi:helix-turn-helix domain-containing protein [Enterobacter cloacae complex sp. ESBL7]|uniref:helix-turn-helix domain-containing protein n=1 Tax=Enterobacter cloacae complex sp. ESBL7 TaxID=3163325 RepID=UPI0035664296
MKTKACDDKSVGIEKIHDCVLAEPGIIHFGMRLKAAMDKGGILSNVALAERAGMSEAVVRSYIKGKTFPTLDRLYILAEACNCSVEWLAIGDASSADDSFKYTTRVKEKVSDATFEENVEFLLLLKRLTHAERETLFDIIFRNGVGAVLSLNNEKNIKLLQLPEAMKSGVLRLANRPDTAIREILSKVERDDPPESVADKKAV